MTVIAWRKFVIAGVAGFACGKGYVWLNKHSNIVRPIIYCSAVSGSVGVLIGLGVAAYRNQPSHIYALSLGANFAVSSVMFLGVRQIISTALLNRVTVSNTSTIPYPPQKHTFTYFPYSTRQVDFMSSGVSGGLAGSLATLLSRYGLGSVMMSGCVCVVLALLGQGAYSQFEKWRRAKAIELHFPELSEPKTRTKWTLATFQERFLGFWHQRSRGIQVNNDFILLTESVKEEQRRIQQVDEELEKGRIDTSLIDSQPECPLDKDMNCAGDSGGQRSIHSTITPDSNLNVRTIVR